MVELLYWLVRGLFAVYFYVFVDIDVQNADKLPEQGPAILCANHFSWFDPPLMSVLAKNKVNFMAKAELFSNPIFDKVFRGVNAFPVRREAMDRSAIRTSLNVLSDGQMLCLFPEGTRQPVGELGELTPGAAYLAIKSGAPLVPVGISGSYVPFSNITVRVGNPIRLDEFMNASKDDDSQSAGGKKAVLAQITQKLSCVLGVLAYGESDRSTA